MIPKKIHYCWFGGNPLPDNYRQYIQTWRKFFPDYEIVEWNEKNFDVQCNTYVSQAYAAKKWAFVSDFARFKILYEQGGIYFDTDVEVIKDMSKLIAKGPFMGTEPKERNGRIEYHIAPGLGLAAESGMPILGEILDFYEGISFLNADGSNNTTTIVKYTTDIFLKHGYLPLENEVQMTEGFSVYPPEYFNPMNPTTKKVCCTGNTYSIHWYSASWHTPQEKRKKTIQKILGKRITGLIVQIKHKVRSNGE